MRLLVIEDESELRARIESQLRAAGFAVDGAADGESGYFMGREYPFDLAVVDLGLPKLSGIEIIRRWRQEGRQFPILILTARDRWQDKVEGLNAGADDYVAKPFHAEELQARINALLRRAAGVAEPSLRCGPIALDMRNQSVQLDGRPLELTAFEYRLLEYLMLHRGKVVSKTELTEHLYDQDFDRDSNVLEVLIGRLRRKLDPDESLQPIETLRGRGYRFALDCENT